MPIDPDATLADLVNLNPAIAATLERQGLDYCCHGQRSLRDAATEIGLDIDGVVTELKGAAGGRAQPADWMSYTPAELVDHIVSTHHVWLRGALIRLHELAAKVHAVHGSNHAELEEVHRLVIGLRSELEPHLAKEEAVVFPAIRALTGATLAGPESAGDVGEPISALIVEHETAGEMLERLREVTGGYAVPADGCTSYAMLYAGLEEMEADTHLHIHKENNILFPAVAAIEAELAGRPG